MVAKLTRLLRVFITYHARKLKRFWIEAGKLERPRPTIHEKNDEWMGLGLLILAILMMIGGPK